LQFPRAIATATARICLGSPPESSSPAQCPRKADNAPELLDSNMTVNGLIGAACDSMTGAGNQLTLPGNSTRTAQDAEELHRRHQQPRRGRAGHAVFVLVLESASAMPLTVPRLSERKQAERLRATGASFALHGALEGSEIRAISSQLLRSCAWQPRGKSVCQS